MHVTKVTGYIYIYRAYRMNTNGNITPFAFHYNHCRDTTSNTIVAGWPNRTCHMAFYVVIILLTTELQKWQCNLRTHCPLLLFTTGAMSTTLLYDFNIFYMLNTNILPFLVNTLQSVWVSLHLTKEKTVCVSSHLAKESAV